MSLRARHWLQASFSGSRREGSIWPNRIVAFVILVGSLLAILETEPDLRGLPMAALFFSLLNPALIAFFVAEYCLRLWAVGVDAQYVGWRGALRWMVQPWHVFDLFLIVIFFLPALGAEVFALRLLRVGRVLAILRLGQATAAGQLLAACIFERRYELAISFLMALLFMVFAAVSLYAIEGESQPDAFGSVPRALWWAMATLTTVGYGDVYPITPAGKFMASLVAFIGIGIIAIPTGIIAGAFANALSTREGRLQNDPRPGEEG